MGGDRPRCPSGARNVHGLDRQLARQPPAATGAEANRFSPSRSDRNRIASRPPNAVTGRIAARRERCHGSLAGRHRDHVAAHAALAREPHVVEPVAGTFVQARLPSRQGLPTRTMQGSMKGGTTERRCNVRSARRESRRKAFRFGSGNGSKGSGCLEEARREQQGRRLEGGVPGAHVGDQKRGSAEDMPQLA